MSAKRRRHQRVREIDEMDDDEEETGVEDDEDDPELQEQAKRTLRRLEILHTELKLFFRPLKSEIRDSKIGRMVNPLLESLMGNLKLWPIETLQDLQDQELISVLFLLYKHLNKTLE